MEIIDLESDFNLNKNFEHTALCKFKRRFELQSVCNDFRFVNINIKAVPFIYGLNSEQYDVDVILNKLNFHLKIVCSTHLYNGFIRSLKIKIYNLNKQKEIAGCTNFLQRQKNLHLALNVMRKCSRLFEDRKLVLQTISDSFPDIFGVTKTDDSGYSITSLDKRRDFLFFESNWSIGWNYRNYDVFDFIDFILNKHDKLFNARVKPILKNLTNPHNTLNDKLKLWKEVLYFVQLSLDNHNDQEAPGNSNLTPNSLSLVGSGCRKRYKNLLENKEFYLIHPEIIEIDSDDDVCMEINEDSDNDIELVNTNLGRECDNKPSALESDVRCLRPRKKPVPSIIIDDISD